MAIVGVDLAIVGENEKLKILPKYNIQRLETLTKYKSCYKVYLV